MLLSGKKKAGSGAFSAGLLLARDGSGELIPVPQCIRDAAKAQAVLAQSQRAALEAGAAMPPALAEKLYGMTDALAVRQ